MTAARQKLNQLVARKARGARVRPRAPAGSAEKGAADSPDGPPKKKGGRPQKGNRCQGARQRAKKARELDGGGDATDG